MSQKKETLRKIIENSFAKQAVYAGNNLAIYPISDDVVAEVSLFGSMGGILNGTRVAIISKKVGKLSENKFSLDDLLTERKHMSSSSGEFRWYPSEPTKEEYKKLGDEMWEYVAVWH